MNYSPKKTETIPSKMADAEGIAEGMAVVTLEIRFFEVVDALRTK